MSGYCKYCDSLRNDIVRKFDLDTGELIWLGCLDCYKKRAELMNN